MDGAGCWLDYSGRRVIVSGCSSGIGRATAARLLDLGAEVHGLDLRACHLPLKSFARVDLRDVTTIDSAIQLIGGRVDALFNCAGVAPGPSPMDVVKVNFIGPKHLTEQVLPLMRRGAAIVNVASTDGADWTRRTSLLQQFVELGAFDDEVAWCAARPDVLADGYRFSKEALIVWTMLRASQLIKRGVRMNCTSPGVVQTPLLEDFTRSRSGAAIEAIEQPIGRRSSPEEQALPLMFLNSRAASFINGIDLTVDGGGMALAALTGQETWPTLQPGASLGQVEESSPAEAGRRLDLSTTRGRSRRRTRRIFWLSSPAIEIA